MQTEQVSPDAVPPPAPHSASLARAAWVGLAAALAIAALVVGNHSFRAAVPLEFDVPEGWLDLSPGAPESRFEGLPGPIAAQARSGRFAAIAVEPVPAGAPLAQTFTALVSPGSLQVGDAAADRLASMLLGTLSRTGGSARVERKDVVRVGGARALRVEARVALGPLEARNVVYAIPAGDRTALLTYSCEESACERLLPLFEASAQATKGAAAPGLLAGVDLGRNVEQGLAILLAGLAAVVIAVGIRRARLPPVRT